MSNTEQTLSIIKPDAVERNLIDEIKKILCDLHVHIYFSLLDLLYAYFFVSQVIIERTTRQIHPESHLTF